MKTSNGIKVPIIRLNSALNALHKTLKCRNDCNSCPFYQDNFDNDKPWNCALLNAREELLEVVNLAYDDKENNL